MRKKRIWLLRTGDSNSHYCKDKTDNRKNKVGPAYTCQNMFFFYGRGFSTALKPIDSKIIFLLVLEYFVVSFKIIWEFGVLNSIVLALRTEAWGSIPKTTRKLIRNLINYFVLINN